MCTVSNNIETSRLNSYICPHSFTPLASQAQITQRCGRDHTNETGLSRQHSAARHSNGGKPEDAPQQYCDVTTIQQTRHFRFWLRQISRWRRRRSWPFSARHSISRSASGDAIKGQQLRVFDSSFSWRDI